VRTFIVLVFIVAFSMSPVFALESQYSLEQLISLMEASMQRYETVTTEMEAVSYKGVDSNGNPKLQRKRQIISRWTKTKSYSKTVEQYADLLPNRPEETIKTVVIAQEWHKFLDEASDDRTPRGHIKQGHSQELAFYPPTAALWDIFCQIPWNKDKLNLDEATVEKDPVSGLLVLKCRLGFQPKSANVILYIDPDKDFIPVIKEFRGYDGELFQRYESVLQKSDSGLWIPKEYSFHDPRMKYTTKFNVKKIIINTPIPEEMLDFTFPSGTFVVDEVASLRYQVDDSEVYEEVFDQMEKEAFNQPCKQKQNSSCTLDKKIRMIL